MRARPLRNLPVPLLAAAAIAILIAAGASLARLTMAPAATPFPVPIYEIEAQSGSCNASILNLGIGYVGALEAPVPVDVDCDLLPDILVAVNLVDIEGPVHDPLATDSTTYMEFIQERGAATLAPNIEFNRYPVDLLATILQQPSPPLRINVVLTITDLEGEEPDTEIRFGYDTGKGGSIPTHFKALVRGLDNFFNPLEAVVDTKGGIHGGDTVPTYYEGPLTLIGGIRTDEGAFDTSLELEYSPWPDVVRVGYASDDAGHHIDYEHGVGELLLLGYGTVLAEDGTFEHYVPGELPEVDVETRMNVLDHADTLDLTAAIDRMPRQIGIDVKTTPDGSGRLDWEATTDGRLPDARVDLVSRTSGVVTTRAEALIEELPPELHALWAFEEDNDIEALFSTTDPDAEGFDLDAAGEGPGIGAIEVLYSNVEQTAFAPHIPTQQQFLNMQTRAGEQLVTGRVERIRGLSFSSDRFGVDVNSRIGDGALPLEANVEIDGLPFTGQLLEANATLFPLPSSIDLSMVTPDEDSSDPFEIVLDSSHTIDIQAHAELRESYAAEALCGEPGTLCTDLGIHHVPAHIAVSMAEVETAEGDGSTTDINVDLIPRDGAPKPDVLLDAVMGKDDSLDDPDAVEAAGPVVFEAFAELRGIPENVRLHFVEGSDETLSELDVSTCDLAVNETCLGVSEPIESVEVLVRNFREDERDEAGVPHPNSVAPQYATVAARGLDDPEKVDDPVVRFEAAGRIKDIREIRYANVEGLFGVRSVIGDNRDLEVVLDIENVIFGGDDDPDPTPTVSPSEGPSPDPEGEEDEQGPIDLLGRVLVSPLPGEIDLCLREAGKDLSLSHPAPFTDICESGDPFGDASVTETPMTLAYDANTPFDVLAIVDFTAHGLDPESDADNHDIHAKVDITAVPSDLTAHIQMPPDVEGDEETEETERMRILAHAPGATNTNIEYTFQDRLGGALCADPQPVDDITCIEGTIDSLSDWMSILVDTGPGEDDIAAKVFACDLNITTGVCNTDTEGDIDEITARARLVTGDPEEEGDLVPFVLEEHPYVDDFTRDTAHVLALRMDQDDGDNLELNAEAVLTDFRSISFSKTADGFDVRTDLGDGVKPLLASVGLDTRFPASAVPPADCVNDEETEEDECAQPKDGDLLFADSRVLPLPEVITISQSGPVEDDDETVEDEHQPLEVAYTSTAPVDVEAKLQQFGQVAGQLCGDHGTMCVTLQLDRLPTTISATVDQFDQALGGADVRRFMTVDIDAIPFDTVAPPDMVIDAMIGATPDKQPPIVHDDTPLIAHAVINGFAKEAGLLMSQVGELLDDDSLRDEQFEEIAFVACELDFNVSPPECTTTPTPIREVAVSVRNFHQRPADFPVPTWTYTPSEDPNDCDPTDPTEDPADSDMMYAEAVMRSDKMEAHGGLTCIREFRMLNVNDTLGVTVRAGDGQRLEAHGDFAGLTGDPEPLPDIDPEDKFDDPLDAFSADAVEVRTLSLDAFASFSEVPTELLFCIRNDGAPVLAEEDKTGVESMVACEDEHPFDDPDDFFEAVPPEDAPMSIAYRANGVINEVTTRVVARFDRQVLDLFEILPGIEILLPAGSLPAMNISGEVTIENLPEHLTAHIETPVENDDEEEPTEDGGPIRALFYYDDSPSFAEGTDQVDIKFDAEYTMGNAVCRDLRERQVAYCFSGELQNLPARVKAFIDPEAPLFVEGTSDLTKNLKIDTFSESGPTDLLNLVNLDVSVVKDDDPDPKKEPLILVAEGDVIGIPNSVRGTIHMEDKTEGANDAPAFAVAATPPLEHLDVEVRNFVAPDPLPGVADPRIDPATGDPYEFEQQIIFIGRGDLFKAIADIRDVHSGGYRTGRNAAGEATETQLINVGFGVPTTGDKPTIRGYVDMLDRDDNDNPSHVFGDVYLDDVPHGIEVCFRGAVKKVPTLDDFDGNQEALDEALAAYVDPLAAPGTQTHCDTHLENGDEVGLPRSLGAFKFQGDVPEVGEGEPEQELDVDALFRMTQGSDTNVLKALAQVENIPNTIEGTFGGDGVSVEMFESDGTTEASLDEVFVHMADFDFLDDGYGAHPPWGFQVPGSAPLPPAQPATQDPGSGPSGHEYARVAVNDANFHVQARIGKDDEGNPGIRITKFIMDPSVCPAPEGAESYFPHYPLVDADDDGELDNKYLCIRGKLLNATSSGSPLLLDADLLLDGMPLKVRDAGLTQVPGFFQVMIAETETLEGDDAALRERCGPAATETDDDCMPPLIHFDSTGDAQLFGRLLLGDGDDSTGDLGDLRNQAPYDTMPDMEALPVPPDVRPGPDQFSQFSDNVGVIAKIGQFQDVVVNGEVFPPTAEPVGPQRTAIRGAFRLAIPKALTIDQIQQWSYENRTSDTAYSEASDLRFHYVMRDASGVRDTAGDLAVMMHNFLSGGQTLVNNVGEDTRGVPIPGEFGIDFYDRNFKGRGHHLVQADLRTSANLDARVRLFHGAGDDLGDSDFRLRGVQGGSAGLTDPDEPTFRLRAEIKGEAEKRPQPGGGGEDDDDWKDALLCIVFCVATDVGAPQIEADLDLAPSDPPTRMVEAAIHMVSDTKLGAEIQGYADVEGNEIAEFAADSGGGTNNPVINPLADGGLQVDIEPLNIFFHVGVPILASFDALILSRGELDLNIKATDNFRLRMNVTRLGVRDSNPLGWAAIGEGSWLTVKLWPGFLQAYLSLFIPFCCYLFYGITAGPIIPVVYHACNPLPTALSVPWVLPISSTELPVTAFLPPPANIFPGSTIPSPLVTYGNLKPILDPVIWGLGPTALCLIFDLDGIDLFSAEHPHPEDPMVRPGHLVPGLNDVEPEEAEPLPDEEAPQLEDLVVGDGETVELCGTQMFGNISIHENGTLNVKAAADDPPTEECPADVAPADVPEGQTPPPPNEGHLRLIAAGDSEGEGGGLTLNGTINAPSGGGQLALTGKNVTINGDVNASDGIVEINAGLAMTVNGTINANAVSESMPTVADQQVEEKNEGTDLEFGGPWADASSGNAGGSHGGEGSPGTGGSPGDPGDTYGAGISANVVPETEQGAPGGASRATNDFARVGNGGGAVVLRGADITVNGTITANGARGDDDASGACEVDIEDNPDTDVDESAGNHPNTGLSGTGGGSGGGIAISGVTVDISDATLRARGARGGDGRGGAGGAGGGGVIRIAAGEILGEFGSSDRDAAVNGGSAGFSLCDDDFNDSEPGDGGVFEQVVSPRSLAFGQTQFWFPGDDVSIPFRAAYESANFNVHLCGIHKGIEATEEAGFGFVMPTGPPESGNPCGTTESVPEDDPPQDQPIRLATQSYSAGTVEDTIEPDSTLPEGPWALWTIASAGDVFAGHCFPFYPFFNTTCAYESTPDTWQTTVGSDNSVPDFTIAPQELTDTVEDEEGEVTKVSKKPSLVINLNNLTDVMISEEDPPRDFELSGVTQVCTYLGIDDTITRESCSEGQTQATLELPTTEREYSVYVVAFDEAGNSSSPLDDDESPPVPDPDTFDSRHTFDVILDMTAPGAGVADITAPATPDGNNDWYLSPPTEYTIDGFDDGADGSGPHPEGAFLYWFDGADPEPCDSPCVLGAGIPLPGEGRHTLNWRARDAAGHLTPPATTTNAEGEVVPNDPMSIEILVDGTTPESAVTVIPIPEFSGQWITADEPLAVARGADAFGGSGFHDNMTDAACDSADPSSFELSGTCISLGGEDGPYVAWTGDPLDLPNGTGQVVCAFSVDEAGNVEVADASADPLINCTEPLNIDNADPTGNITINPTVIGDWYDFDQGVPAVTFDNYDGTGSPEPFFTGGFRYRIDNGPEETCHDPCTIPVSELSAGSNILHWTVVDSAGNRRPEQVEVLRIDLDFPRTYILPAPFAPTGSNDWYLEKAQITLAAFDQVNPSGPDAPPPPLRPTESGVDTINYTIDGNPFIYGEPFPIDAGAHEVCVNAVDVAGNHEADLEREDDCEIFKVDLAPPNTTVFENGLNPPTIDGDNGWYRDIPVVITTTATDPTPGSLVVPQDFGPNLCDHTPDDNPAPAGICISVDGRAPGAGINGPEFGPYDGRTPITLGEGEHVIRAYSVDNAGRRSAMEREIVQIDRSDPVTVARLRAPYASRDGLERPWWRHQPSLVLRGLDGDHNSGVELIEYRINGGTPETYTGPVTLPVGKNFVEHRAQDASGRFGPWIRKDVAVDVNPPFVKALKPDPALWLQVKLLGLITFSEDAKLNWKLRDDLSGPVQVKIIVYNQLGMTVRHLDAGIHHVTPGETYFGSTNWDGRTGEWLEDIISAGIYYYRVIAYDDAGNVAMSGESQKLQVKLKVSTCVLLC